MNTEDKYIVFDIETTGLDPWFGNMVTCICAKTHDDLRISFTLDLDDPLSCSELKNIKRFLYWVNTLNINWEYKIITKNGRKFDIPFMMARVSLLSGRLEETDTRILHYRQFDLHEITKKWVSLDDMARLLRCKSKTNNGINAITMWQDSRYKELTEYCMNDVEVTEEVYLKYNFLKTQRR